MDDLCFLFFKEFLFELYEAESLPTEGCMQALLSELYSGDILWGTKRRTEKSKRKALTVKSTISLSKFIDRRFCFPRLGKRKLPKEQNIHTPFCRQDFGTI